MTPLLAPRAKLRGGSLLPFLFLRPEISIFRSPPHQKFALRIAVFMRRGAIGWSKNMGKCAIGCALSAGNLRYSPAAPCGPPTLSSSSKKFSGQPSTLNFHLAAPLPFPRWCARWPSASRSAIGQNAVYAAQRRPRAPSPRSARAAVPRTSDLHANLLVGGSRPNVRTPARARSRTHCCCRPGPLHSYRRRWQRRSTP